MYLICIHLDNSDMLVEMAQANLLFKPVETAMLVLGSA